VADDVRKVLADELGEIRKRERYRILRSIESPAKIEIFIGGKKYLNFSSNDYLGLAASEKLVASLAAVGWRWGIGSGASRLICGNMEVHDELEQRIADFKGAPCGLVFSSGYMANLGILSTLGSPGTTVFSDELNHASIIDGCRLSRAKVKVYRHADAGHLQDLLSADEGKRKIIITDGVFSMDGDIAPLADLCYLKEKYGAILVVDDAHATGVVGEGGRGTASLFGLSGKVDIQMGTFSKALGTYGAFICCDSIIREYFINRCRPFIFNTAIPPLIAALTVMALRHVEENPQLVEQLKKKVDRFTAGLEKQGVPVRSETPIIPVIIGSDRETVEISRKLFDEGFYVYGVRPPTVPENTARLRVTLSAAHGDDQIDLLTERIAYHMSTLKRDAHADHQSGVRSP
jgi:8-amino-7-oxononanoate synthase